MFTAEDNLSLDSIEINDIRHAWLLFAVIVV